MKPHRTILIFVIRILTLLPLVLIQFSAAPPARAQAALYGNMSADPDRWITWATPEMPPRFMLNVNNDGSWRGADAWNWPLDSQVTLTVDDPVYSETQTMQMGTNGYTHAMYMQDGVFQGHPGSTITVSYGSLTKSMKVPLLTITGSDLLNDTVSGKTDAFTTIVVCVTRPDGSDYAEFTVTADQDGNWTADFTGLHDLAPGDSVEPQYYDEDSDHVVLRDWFVPAPAMPPRFMLNVNNDGSWRGADAWYWPIGSEVTMTIDDPLYTETQTMSLGDGERTHAMYMQGVEVAGHPGSAITVSDGTQTKTLNVPFFTITGWSLDNNALSGKADAGLTFIVAAGHAKGEPLAEPTVTADADGNWSVSFDETYHLQPYDSVEPQYVDEDGDHVVLRDWYAPDPRIMVDFTTNSVHGLDFVPGRMATVTITGGGNSFTQTKRVEADPYGKGVPAVDYESIPFTIQTGFFITLTDGVNSKTHTVTGLKITEVNEVTDTVSGTANAQEGAVLEVWPDQACSYTKRFVTVQPDGTWTADFSQPVPTKPGEEPQPACDVKLGMEGRANQPDEDHDSTEVPWPYPYIAVRLDELKVLGYEWAAGKTVTLTVDDPSTPQAVDYTDTQVVQPQTPWGSPPPTVEFDYGGKLDLQPGFVVMLSDGIMAKTLVVVPLEVVNVDPATDIVSGKAAPSSETIVYICEGTQCNRRVATADSSGQWIAGFAEQGDPPDQQPVFDIQPGTAGGARQEDTDRDYTRFGWLAPLHVPQILSLSGPSQPIPLGATAGLTATFDDAGGADSYLSGWDWGDGTVTPMAASLPSVTGSHVYTKAGVYTVEVTITDSSGKSDVATFQYVVVYDSSGGFVTGGGWISSPAGAYAADPALTGRASFGFVSRYQKGASVPSGETEFHFQVAGLSFKSTSYDWLVIAGSKAQFKGLGTINGSGRYAFLLTAADGTPDKFRIKIWDKDLGTLIYDNQLGASDSATPFTPLGGGAVVIHK